jgi:hypothetical protein
MTRKQIGIQFATSFDEIAAEVRAVIERHGAQRNLGVLASLVVNNHPDVKGRDRDFHLCGSFRAIRTEIIHQLNKRRRKPTPEQADFCLKEAYNVTRDEAQLHLPLEELTFEELMEKADEYTAGGQSLLAEAEALRRYAFEKFPARAESWRDQQRL